MPFVTVHLVPDTAIVQESPQRTFADMRHSVANQRTVATRRFGDDIQGDEADIAIGCGSYSEDSYDKDAMKHEEVII